MTCSITTRPMAPADRPRQPFRYHLDDLAWLLLPPTALGGVGAALGLGLRWLLRHLGLPAPHLALWSAALLALAGAFLSAWVAARVLRARGALAHEIVEVIHVRDAPYIRSTDDGVPTLLIDVGACGSLLVSGEALDDPSTFRRRGAFPSTEFVLHRGLGSGRLIRIDVLGAPLEPLAEVPSIARLLAARISLEDLAETLVLDVPFAEWTRTDRPVG